ncbi:Uncharacterised protein [Enterobacter hormaechei]|nr:Uncharacterised protein [Enterobacter hormaechei]
MLAFAQLLPGRHFREQVDHRRAVQRQVAGIHYALQLIVALVEQNEDIKRFFVFAALDQLAQPAQADETKTRRERKVLLQQAIAVEVAQIVREQRLVRIKAFLTQGVRRQQLALGLLADRLADNTRVVLHHQLQQLQRLDVRAA